MFSTRKTAREYKCKDQWIMSSLGVPDRGIESLLFGLFERERMSEGGGEGLGDGRLAPSFLQSSSSVARMLRPLML